MIVTDHTSHIMMMRKATKETMAITMDTTLIALQLVGSKERWNRNIGTPNKP